MACTPARLAVAMAIAITSLAHAGDPVPLNKEETQKALAGKSITYPARGGGAAGGSIVIFFATEGRMTLKMTTSPRTSSGTWSVEDDGRYCIKVTSGTASDGCRRLLKTDTGYAMKTGSGEIVPVDKME
jgi:hypothetical protein